jgi:hypothetical protein
MSLSGLWSGFKNGVSYVVDTVKTHKKKFAVGVTASVAIGGYLVYRKFRPV